MWWKRALQILVESCVYMDPYGCMYYAAVEREEAERAWGEQVEADEQQILRLIEIDRLESRREAQA